ncbi:MAG: hypothetical protein RLZZ87_47 [Actinomycetota bacterium]
MELLHTRGIFTAPFTHTPIKFRDHLLPEFFTCTAYLVDNQGKKVTNENFRTFKVWSIELLLKTSKGDHVEVIRTTILGSRKYDGHTLVTTKSFDPVGYGAVQVRHYDLARENRSRLMGYAVQVAIQSNIYKKSKDGGHSWEIGGRKDVSDSELTAIFKSVADSAYVRLDDAFYKDFSEKYLKAEKATGTPIQELAATEYPGKDIKTIQRWATTARKKEFLPKTSPGKASSATTRKKGK